jgi:uncharacterized protein YbjT (DUF2867 family)
MQDQRTIAVAGATGRVGRHVVGTLREAGHQVVPVSRSAGVDVITGDGLPAALAGVDCVVDAATGPSPEQQPATEFFTVAARNLHEAASRAGVQRIVVVSIIGCDRFAGGYEAAKVAHERAHAAGAVPVQILRAAQFHELVSQMVEWGTQGDVCYVPAMRIQPIAARTVAEALADLAVGAGLPGSAPGSPGAPAEIAGPQVEDLVDLAGLLVSKRGDPVRIEGVSDPATAGLYENEGLLPGPGAVIAGPAFREWLDSPA